MIKVAGFAVTAVLALVHTAAAAECEIPRNMTKEQKDPCVRGASLMRDQPTLTMEQLGNGPDFNGGDPGSEFLYFTAEDNPTCYFRPHYAFKAVKGKSLKFQCWQLAADRHLLDQKGQPIATTDIKVVLEENSGGENRAHLYAKTDTTNQNEIDARSLQGEVPEAAASGTRSPLQRGVHRARRRPHSVGAGIPGRPRLSGRFGQLCRMHGQSVREQPGTEFGCSERRSERIQDGHRGAGHPLEREIDPENDETWSWQDAAQYDANGTWTPQQKLEVRRVSPGAGPLQLSQCHRRPEPGGVRGVQGGRKQSQNLHEAVHLRAGPAARPLASRRASSSARIHEATSPPGSLRPCSRTRRAASCERTLMAIERF